ncbi:MAG: hypothetical protein ACHQ9S_07755 [Candidatus Binatia bacterium]
MAKNLNCFLVLLILGIPHSVHADDACELERTYRDQLAAMQSERVQKASRIEGVNSTIAQLRSQFPVPRHELAGLREQIDNYLNQRRAIYADLRLMRDTLKQTSKKVAKAHRKCIRSKGGNGSPLGTPGGNSMTARRVP